MKTVLLAWVTTAILVVGLPLSTVALADEAFVRAACAADKSPRLKEIHDRGMLRWAIGIAPPFGARVGPNEYIGTEAENAKDFAEILGVELEIRDYTYDLLPPTVATGNADIVGAALYITDARKKVIDFSDVYEWEGSFYVALGSRDDLNSLEDLNRPEVTVVVNVGSGYVDLSRKVIPNANIVTADLVDYSRMANFLIGGQADATMLAATEYPLLDRAVGDVPLKSIGTKGVSAEGIPRQDELIEPFDVGFGVRKGDPGFLNCVNAFVADLLESGRFRERYVRWVKTIAEGSY